MVMACSRYYHLLGTPLIANWLKQLGLAPPSCHACGRPLEGPMPERFPPRAGKQARSPPWWCPTRTRLFLSLLALSLGALAMVLAPAPLAPPAPVAPQEEPCPALWTADVSGDAGLYPIAGSLQPLKGQKKAPCHKLEVEVNGVCWLSLSAKPPCPTETAEHKGQCLLPVASMPKAPTSIDQEAP